MGSPSQKTAFELVKEISKKNGYLSEEILETMPPETRRVVVETTSNLHRMAGSSVVTLAKNVYASNARFVFELLQNADDNQFSRARARDEVPYITFKVAPRHIIVECNEDGFSPENLKAICDIGNSTKTGTQGYIGEKGIGFKSVFMVAYKVHIQSGNFSFSFNHRPGDSGIGMISPVWEDTNDHPPSGITRIKLFLHDDGDAATREARYQTIIRQFEDIRDDYLLFLKNIGRINVIFLDNGDRETSSTRYFSRSSPSTPLRTSLVTSRDNGQEKVSNYHVTKYVARNLPRSEIRTYTETEEAARVWSTSQVVLAFPVDEESEPVIKSQDIFAFLPIRTMGFKFLIQADFATQANRQDIVTTSSRNIALIEGLAEAFIAAMQQLCTDDHLQYKWMRYLPRKDDFPWDRYWLSLIDRIESKIKGVPLFRPRSEGSLLTIGQVGILPRTALHNGEPIFDDIDPEIYLSPRYIASDLNRLRHVGLQPITMDLLVYRARADLRHPRSKMKSASTSEQWHTAAAKLLSFPFEKNFQASSKLVLDLELIPLQDDAWISSSSAVNPLTFPTVSGVAVPTDLPLTLINSSAVLNTAREKLFAHLGARYASVSLVRQLILNKYLVSGGTSALSRSIHSEEISLNHLKFLYRTHGRQSEKAEFYHPIAVFTEERVLKTPKTQDVYIPDDRPFGVRDLLRPVTDPSEPACGAPGFPVDFLSSRYLDDSDVQEAPKPNMPWITWLHDILGIRTSLKLIQDGAVTDIFRYIMDHRADVLIGVLQDSWSDIGLTISNNQSIQNEISRTHVPTGEDMVPLRLTWLPLPNLEEICRQYLMDISSFPFLPLPNTPASKDKSAWEFLHDIFDVGNSDNVKFYLKILKRLRSNSDSLSDTVRIRKAFDVYRVIYAQIIGKGESTTDVDSLRDDFELYDLIFVPANRPDEHVCISPLNCRWDASHGMEAFEGIAYRLEPIFAEDPDLRRVLTPFLQDVVGVTNMSWEDIFVELDEQKHSKHTNNDIVHQMYERLAVLHSKMLEADCEALKGRFQQESWIFVMGGWHKVTACLWSSATIIPGKTTLNYCYPEMKTFFVDFLGVSTLTLEVAYEALKKKGLSDRTTVSEMKQELWQFNSLLSTSKNTLDPKPVLEGRTFPVKLPDGSVQLLSTSTDFAIVDRKALGDIFSTMAKMLDFTLDEVHRLEPFLQWAGIDDRRLSVKVAEITTPTDNGEFSVRESNRNIKSRAYALCRIATHFKSPRVRGDSSEFFQILVRSMVIETDGISSELHLIEDGRTLKVHQSQSELHMDTTGDDLKIYIPKDSVRQDICFHVNLPHAMSKWMMNGNDSAVSTMEDQRATRLISSILNTNPSSFGRILDMEGIIELGFPEQNTTTHMRNGQNTVEAPESVIERAVSTYTAIQSQRAVTPVSFVSSIDSARITTPALSISSSSEASPKGRGRTDQSPPNRAEIRTPESSPLYQSTRAQRSSGGSLNPFLPSPQPARTRLPATPSRPSNPLTPENIDSFQGTSYVSLLGKVIQAARKADLSSKGAFDMAALRAALSEIDGNDESTDDYFRMRSTSQIERDKMVGAAGELYVFELLCHMNPRLPFFSRALWQSTIRKYVTVHPDYADMRPWNGRETADIIYTDSDGILTTAFIKNRYLDEKIWKGRKPTYYIEVKTTTGPCQTPFYMSKHQYKRMCDMSNGLAGTENADKIYVVFRIFNLGRESMDYAVHIDPYVMKQKGTLKFTAETWSVVSAPSGY
ncbi:hypothetical protein F4779DRAFT_606565 [Xylariaceae sp. FL0662B]|nr:hypothetical protein F4779DRAFT_606565 [Xylariaceae sp. FL0662B]